MKGLVFKSKLKYPITVDISEIIRKLEFEDVQYRIKQQPSLVQYKFDHEIYMRLSFFLYLQKIELIKITLAQNMQICLDIIEKLRKMKEKQITHNYLSLDRIWLRFYDGCLSVMPHILKYSIYFVGYDCPFYELGIYQKIDDNKQVIELVKIIISYSQKYKKRENVLQAENRGIFKMLLEDGINKGIDAFVQQSKEIFSEYQNKDNNNQVLSGIDSEFLDTNFKRGNRVYDIKNNLILLVNEHYVRSNSLKFHLILHKTLPDIANQLNNTIFYSLIRSTGNVQQKVNITQFCNDLKNINEVDVQKLIQNQITQLEQYYKFKCNLQDMLDEVKKQLQIDFKLLDYYLNDYTFYLDNEEFLLKQAIPKFKNEITQKVVAEYFDAFEDLLITGDDFELI